MKKSNINPRVTRSAVARVLLNCVTPEQVEGAMRYIELSGYMNDKIMQEYIKLKNKIELI